MHLSRAQASLTLHSVFTVFASEDVLRCEAMCGDVVACAGASCVPIGGKRQSRAAHRHKAMRLAQELGELNIERGVFKVFVQSALPRSFSY